MKSKNNLMMKSERSLLIFSSLLLLLTFVMAFISLRTNTWSIIYSTASKQNHSSNNLEWSSSSSTRTPIEWYGLFDDCHLRSEEALCTTREPYNNFAVVFLSLIGIILVLSGMLLSFMMAFKPFFRQHYYIVPSVLLLACIAQTICFGLFVQHSNANGYSSKLWLTAIVFTYTSLALVSFVCGIECLKHIEQQQQKENENEMKKNSKNGDKSPSKSTPKMDPHSNGKVNNEKEKDDKSKSTPPAASANESSTALSASKDSADKPKQEDDKEQEGDTAKQEQADSDLKPSSSKDSADKPKQEGDTAKQEQADSDLKPSSSKGSADKPKQEGDTAKQEQADSNLKPSSSKDSSSDRTSQDNKATENVKVDQQQE
ncbi:unnamed protein product [Didymodactylos carnosus]|uniref:Uncharacterized protein n=1 Tax=Didymodactylos carnosus TaxID=1234261 RepID=A0A814FQY7_9BILA|nr:unnamed protein product [Didymodactylos carnosus]CAF1247724.1 unnamed protein product [Didymodactylos carnosus]CAF3755951.1 unnamed protein product [Didymodactylos carnosus]CAF4055467.1 unnamed protein product [Didymodactylos carnosus]